MNVEFCPQCGKKNEAMGLFCNNCGTRLSNEVLNNGFNKENTQKNYTSEEMNLFISKNQMYYTEKFEQIERTGNKKTWNWSAFLISVYWMLYRKMYLQAGAYFLANLVFSFIPIIGWILNLVLWVCAGMYSNSLYLDHMRKKFTEIDYTSNTNREALIIKKGGTNIALPIILACIPLILVILFLCLFMAIASMY